MSRVAVSGGRGRQRLASAGCGPNGDRNRACGTRLPTHLPGKSATRTVAGSPLHNVLCPANACVVSGWSGGNGRWLLRERPWDSHIGSDQGRLLDYPATRAVDYLDNRAARGARVCRVSSVPCRAGRTAGAGHGPRNRVPAGGVSQAAAHAPARRLLAQLPSGPRRHSGVLLAGAETSP